MIETFRLTIQTDHPHAWPRYPGSMLRGAFGHALKRTTCMTKLEKCPGCPLINSCPYTAIFETQSRTDLTNRPSPYIIQPIGLAQDPCQYTFNLTLIGADSLNQLPLLIFVWQKALQRGLGKQNTPAQLKTVQHLNHNTHTPLYEDGEQIQTSYPTTPLPSPQEQNHPLNIHITTPMRLSRRNQLIGHKEFNLKDWMAHIIRRNKFIFQHHLPNQPLDSQISLDNLNQLQPEHQNLYWEDWQRYSNRQQQAMTLGGLIGQLKIQANTLTPTQYQHLKLAEKLNIGKNTVFGMGHIKMHTSINPTQST